MRGIPEERLKVIAAMPASVFEAPASEIINYLIAKECQELQEPWMTLEEFLESGFEGLCWVCVNKVVYDLIEYRQGAFYFGSSKLRTEVITDVMPIHKPESPR